MTPSLSTPSTTPASPLADAPGWRWAPFWVLAFVALWPISGYAETVLAVGALVATCRFVLTSSRGGQPLLSTPAFALTCVLFAAYWLPQVLSTWGAVDPIRALRESLVDLRYLPFLWLAAAAVVNARGRRITFHGLALIVLVWGLDALLHAVIGASPLFWVLDQLKQLVSGHSFCPAQAAVSQARRVTGVFGPCNIKLGVVLASLAPFLLYLAAWRWRMIGWTLAAVLLGIGIVSSGMRAAWVSYFLVLLVSGWQLFGWKKALAGCLCGVLTFTAMGLGSNYVSQRLDSTALAVTGDVAGVDAALSGRLRVWSAALCMIAQYPFTGVGARGFRSAFPDCDPAQEQPAAWGEGPAFHAHQIVLEIASETGLIGLLLWLLAVALAWRAWSGCSPARRQQAHPAMLALAVTVFPLNTHLAVYSTMWGGLTLLLAALYAGSVLSCDDADVAPKTLLNPHG